MPEDPGCKHTILYDAPEDALSPRTDVILARLGYRLLKPDTFATRAAAEPGLRPDLLLVDESRLVDVEALGLPTEGGAVPIVLLTGRQGAPAGDRRIVGAVKRPAGLHDLYRLLQQVFEDTPRAMPRVATQLRARCEANGSSWEGRVLSLSENGCLMRSPEAILLGQQVRLELDLPRSPSVCLDAEATYQLLPDTGLVFSALEARRRAQLWDFVSRTLLA